MRKRRNLFIITNYIKCNSGAILIKDPTKNIKVKNINLKFGSTWRIYKDENSIKMIKIELAREK